MTHLEDGLGSVALHVVAVDDDLDDAVPHLFRDVVASNTDQVEDHVHVPCVVRCIFLCQDGHFQHLQQQKQVTTTWNETSRHSITAVAVLNFFCYDLTIKEIIYLTEQITQKSFVLVF